MVETSVASGEGHRRNRRPSSIVGRLRDEPYAASEVGPTPHSGGQATGRPYRFGQVVEAGEQDPAEVFARLARRLGAETSPDEARDQVTQSGVQAVDGCDHADISVIRRRGGIETVAATDDVPPRVDGIQYGGGQGPGL